MIFGVGYSSRSKLHSWLRPIYYRRGREISPLSGGNVGAGALVESEV
jgi:hypothetical protein